MKQKIKIMKNQPQPSDEEVQSYMNFDNLLVSRKTAMTRYRVYSILKWSVLSLLLTGLVGWFLFVKEPGKTVPPAEPKKKEVASESVNGGPDTTVNTDAVTKVKENNEAISIAAPDSSRKAEVSSTTVPPGNEEAYVQAEPQNGYSSLYEYFAANLIYPSEALADSTQGVQTISFIINRNGTPEKISITNSLGEPFDREARRLIEGMPGWNPATLNGKPVASKVSLPLTFQIQKVKN